MEADLPLDSPDSDFVDRLREIVFGTFGPFSEEEREELAEAAARFGDPDAFVAVLDGKVALP